MLNKVELIGRVGKDPEIKSSSNGNQFAVFSLATSEKWKDKQGNKQEKTEWHNVVCFNESLVKVISQYVNKGDMLYIEGKLQTRKWQANDGSDRYSTEVILENYNSKLIMLGSKSERLVTESNQYDNQVGTEKPISDQDILF